MKRRKFISNSTILAGASAIPFSSLIHHFETKKRLFKICLNPGIIGVKGNQSEILDMAIQYGYEAIIPMTNQLMAFSDTQIKELTTKMEEYNISWGSANIPVEYRKTRQQFNDDFKNLRNHCQILEKVGASRMNTWIFSSHNELTYIENMKLHAYRLGECAKVMKDHGIRLGLEYLGPKTMLAGSRYPFVSTMKEMKLLLSEIGETNVGFVLDSFHWYCAADTADDIRTLTPEDIITVDINDCRAGFERLEQVDGARELPLATGIIDIKSFLQALIDIGYDGPLRTEPFNKVLNDMENDEALQVNMDAIRKALALVGE